SSTSSRCTATSPAPSPRLFIRRPQADRRPVVLSQLMKAERLFRAIQGRRWFAHQRAVKGATLQFNQVLRPSPPSFVPCVEERHVRPKINKISPSADLP